MTEIDESVAPSGASGSSVTAPADAPPMRTESPVAATTPVAAGDLTRRGRVRKWDRPPPPKDWRWWVGNLGKTLIAIGLLMFGFVAYQLWGTGIETARAQRALESDFEELLAEAPPVQEPIEVVVEVPVTADTPTQDAGEADPAPADEPAAPAAPAVTETIEVLPVAAQNIPEVESGDAVARIEIPDIGVDDIVVAGVSTGDLKKGPGHFPDTPLPGQLGNSAIAGHRTTYGQPFHNVDKLEVGDDIVVTTLTGTYVYKVTGQTIVSPSAYEVVSTTDPTKATLTLTSCHPKWTARERIVIFSELDTEASAIVGEPVINYGQPLDEPDGAEALPAGADGEETDGEVVAEAGEPTSAASESSESSGASGTLVEESTVGVEAVTSQQAEAGIADAFSEGWFSDPGANPHVLFWGLLLALIGVGAYLLSRRFKRDWVGLVVGIIPFTVTLYFFFQNVNRLLPPNL